MIFSDNKCFEEGEYFEYEGTNLLFSNYPQRALKDDYTVWRIGRIWYNPDEEDQVINDIPFDKEVLDLETQEYTQGDLNVSNQHVTILNSNGRYFLVDLGSSNSTFIQVIDNVILREGMVFDITKDNLFVVEKIILPKDYKVSQPDDSTLDPYFLFLEGKDMCKEFLSVNSTRIKKYSFISMKPQVPMLQLRFLERNKAKIDGDSSTKLITIEQSSVSLDDQLWMKTTSTNRLKIINTKKWILLWLQFLGLDCCQCAGDYKLQLFSFEIGYLAEASKALIKRYYWMRRRQIVFWNYAFKIIIYQ